MVKNAAQMRVRVHGAHLVEVPHESSHRTQATDNSAHTSGGRKPLGGFVSALGCSDGQARKNRQKNPRQR